MIAYSKPADVRGPIGCFCPSDSFSAFASSAWAILPSKRTDQGRRQDLTGHDTAKSAEKAGLCLKKLTIEPDRIARCKTHIIETSTHDLSSDPDTNFFTDADLSVLGQPWDQYEQYTRNVRKEYAMFPDFVYNPGRKKVLDHFLQMDSIFKTSHFKTTYENQARNNLRKELDLFAKS